MTQTIVEILDKSLNRIAQIKNLYPITNDGMVLRYSKELSDYGRCLFRIRSNDPIFTQLGDILVPHKYSVRIKRGGTTVWQGAIVDNKKRTKNYIEVEAYEYLYYLDKILVRRTSNNPANGTADGIFRIFESGTMSTAVSGLVTDAVADFGGSHPLAGMTIGTIENPNYPDGFTDGTTAVTGAWSFTANIALQFDFHSVYYVLKAFGIYADADFQIDESLTFNFEKFLGNKQNAMTFHYGTRGNIVDYNSPRLGRRMVNDLWGIAADTSGKIYHLEQKDTTSLNEFGKLEDSNAYADVKDNNFLRSRLTKDLRFIKSPDDSPLNLLLDEKAYPLGQYDIGDLISIRIKDSVIDVNQRRRVVGITVNLHETGRELISVQTNIARAEDLGA
jgi:hypothetical protein